MSVSRLLQRAKLVRRSHLAVVMLPDEATAFQAYRLLQSHGISPEHLAIVGEGYSSPERVGLLEPMQIAMHKAKIFACLTGSTGCFIGTALVLALHIHLRIPPNPGLILTVLAAGIICGFCGAFIGAVVGFLGEGNISGIYRHHLSQGRYLLMMEGPEKLVRWGQEILNHYATPKIY